MSDWISGLLGNDASELLEYESKTFPRESLHLPGADFIDRIFVPSDRNPQVLNNLARLFGHGRLAGTGYVSILPVDQGIEHSAGASFAPKRWSLPEPAMAPRSSPARTWTARTVAIR